MALNPGTTLGSYSVTAKIGEGGMGEVYRARDTKLDRDVALKVLPEAFTSDPDRLARFEREAKVLASLNHPNIAAIYGLEEAGDTRALVLELVEGPTLADRIAKGPIPLDEALPIAKQIAEALEAAHEAGVIHRDLKPANIKVREDGTVKVLDFGLAKALDPTPEGDPSQSPTLTAAATQMGVIMGTAAYMSPEQARGKPTDRRADIWAFGAVLFEILTGKRAFEGEDVSVTLANVINQPPDWERLPGGISPSLQTYLRRCLDKDPTRRVQAIGDVRLAMEGAFDSGLFSPDTNPAGFPAWRRFAVWGGAAAVVALAALALNREGSPVIGPVVRVAVTTDRESPLDVSLAYPDIVISPDGGVVVWQGGSYFDEQLYARRLSELSAVSLPSRGAGAYAPFFSPNSAWIGVFDGEGIYKIATAGGLPVSITSIDRAGRGAGSRVGVRSRGGTWGQDDAIVFATNAIGEGLWRVSAAGGEPEAISALNTATGETGHYWPSFLPDGRYVLLTVSMGGIMTETSPPSPEDEIALLDLKIGEHVLLGIKGSHPRYVETGHVLFGREGGLSAASFSLSELRVTGPPVPVLEDVSSKVSGAFSYDVAVNGSLVYVEGAFDAAARTLVRVDRNGRATLLPAPLDRYSHPRLSSDGDLVAVQVAGFEDQAPSDIWIYATTRNTRERLTVDGGDHPIWNSTGSEVMFSNGGRALLTKPVGVGGQPTLVWSDERNMNPVSWHPDESVVALEVNVGGDPNIDIWLLRVDGATDPEPLIVTRFKDSAPAFSPDGTWLAYVSDETGRDEIYVQAYPDASQRFPVSSDGGREPVWSPDGTELFYRNGYRMMSVPVRTGPSLELGNPVELFEQEYQLEPGPSGHPHYGVAPDAQSFLMIQSSPASVPAQGLLLLNWFEELRQLVPAN